MFSKGCHDIIIASYHRLSTPFLLAYEVKVEKLASLISKTTFKREKLHSSLSISQPSECLVAEFARFLYLPAGSRLRTPIYFTQATLQPLVAHSLLAATLSPSGNKIKIFIRFSLPPLSRHFPNFLIRPVLFFLVIFWRQKWDLCSASSSQIQGF